MRPCSAADFPSGRAALSLGGSQDPGSATALRVGLPCHKGSCARCGLSSTSCSGGCVGGPCSHWAPQLPAQNEEAEPRSSCSLAPLPSQAFLPGPLAGWGSPVCRGGEWGNGSSGCSYAQCCHQAQSPARKRRARLCAKCLYLPCVLIPRKGGVPKSHLHSHQ